jgi:uncharacterized protein
MALPLHVFEPRYRTLINYCLATDTPFGVVLIRSGQEVGTGAQPFPVGTTARVSNVERLPDGRMNIEALGQDRFVLRSMSSESGGALTGTVEPFPLLTTDSGYAQRSAQALTPWLRQYLDLLTSAAQTTYDRMALPGDPAALAYLAAIVAQIPMAEKQELLSMSSAADMLHRERAILRREISLMKAMLASRYARADNVHSVN